MFSTISLSVFCFEFVVVPLLCICGVNISRSSRWTKIGNWKLEIGNRGIENRDARPGNSKEGGNLEEKERKKKKRERERKEGVKLER